jgi:F-type H+-transporting ATPase subunit alpha
MATGIRAIDSLVPIGNGQRELIGDRQTGKSYCRGYYYSPNNTKTKEADYALGALGTTCIGAEKLEYLCLCIGQKKSSVANLANKLTEANAMNWTTIVAATASDPAPLQF